MLKKILRKIYRTTVNLFSGIGWYLLDLISYKKLLKKNSTSQAFYLFPQIFDKDSKSHTFDKHYVYMDRWAFKRLILVKPEVHIDVGSSIRFLSMASAITKLKFVDIRPVNLDFDNFECIEGSILQLPFDSDSINSLSCLHVAEHIGLGRYGDPLDPLGTEKSCAELARVLKPEGKLYFALPVGKPAVYFNAHRVHSPKTILEYFKNLKLVSFSAVDDWGHFISQAEPAEFENSIYACGMFEFTK